MTHETSLILQAEVLLLGWKLHVGTFFSNVPEGACSGAGTVAFWPRVRELLVAAMSGEDFLTIDRPRNKDPRLGTPIQTLLFHSTRFYVPKLSQLN